MTAKQLTLNTLMNLQKDKILEHSKLLALRQSKKGGRKIKGSLGGSVGKLRQLNDRMLYEITKNEDVLD